MNKKILFFTIPLFMAVLSTHAATASREDALKAIENTFTHSTDFTEESPFVDQVLQSVAQINQGMAPELIKQLRPEIAGALNEAKNSNGGLIANEVRGVASGLTDQEVVHLADIMRDPVLLKFQAGMAKPEIQRKLAQENASLPLRLGSSVNEVLTRHGLKNIH